MPEPKSIQSMMEAISEVAEYGNAKRAELAEAYGSMHGDMKKKKKMKMAEEEEVDPAEDIVVEFLEGFLGDSINESTSEEDQNEAILEAVASLNNLCAIVNEYFETTEAYQYAVESLQQEG